MARKAEAATLDAIFVADHIAVWDTVPSGLTHYANARLEPLTLLSALAAVTEHIGLMATASTSYNEPYNLARYFASLDFLSNGRASWNVVTSWLEEEAANFGLEQLPATAPRYQRASEFIDVVTRLGIPGKMARRSSIKRTDYSPMPARCITSTIRASTFACAARSTSLSPAAGPSAAGAGRLFRGGKSAGRRLV
ncbi:LLM class flavin-dependent oxidoreductase [Klebsiella variicola subsp. variicola]|nr:LLM class flavin-dependent oxidoreductase [Klebsiella variicola subsp. variicola]